MAKIADLTANTPVDSITFTVTEKGEVRDVRGGSLRVCDCKVKDDSGEITLTLWNDDCTKVEKGDSVTITKGWVSEYQGDKKISSGKFGQLDVQKGEGAPAEEPKQEVDSEVMEAMDEDII